MSEERGLQIIGTDLKVGDEDLVKLGLDAYQMKVMSQEKEIQKAIKETEALMLALDQELEKLTDDVAIYKVKARDIASSLLKPLGIGKVEKSDTTADYREKSKGTDGEVAIHIHIHWKNGTFTHTLTRKLTKAEKVVIRRREAAVDHVRRLQEALLEIKAIQGRYPMLADHVRANVTRAKLAKVAPELLKTVEINLPEFNLPEIPKLSRALPAPK